MALRVVVALAAFAAGVVGPATTTLTAAVDSPPISRNQAAAIIQASTVQVVAFACDLRRNEGTAVALTGGRLLTNAHVVAHSRLIDVAADDLPTIVGGAPTVAPGPDLALVSAPGLSAPPMRIAWRAAAPGAAVWVAGYPGGAASRLTITPAGVLNYVAGGPFGEPGQVMRLTVTVRPGMSGGPVIDGSGNLAGIVFGDELPSGRALAIPARTLTAALSSPFAGSTCG